MNKLTAEQLLMIYQKRTGEEIKKSETLLKKLEEISKMPYEQDERFFYKYKNTVAKASKLGCAIARIKPFPEKNTQTAIVSMLTLLKLNRVKLVDYENDLPTLATLIQAGDVTKTGQWIEYYEFREDSIEQIK